MTGDGQSNPAANPAANPAPSKDAGTGARPPREGEPDAYGAALDEIGPADPALEPGADLRRRLVRAART